jgi:hypothetical protein
MFVEQIRQAVTAAPRVELPKVSALLWKAYAAGSVTEAQATELSEMIEARKALPTPEKPARRRVGSRPRSPASMERRRSWAAAGRLPPALASKFTLAEQSVLAVVAMEVAKHSACTLTIGHIAALAGVSETTVRNAMREAHALGLVRIEERRLTAWRNAPNRVTITSPEWLSWLRLRPKGEGANSYSPRATVLVLNRRARGIVAKGCRKAGSGRGQGQDEIRSAPRASERPDEPSVRASYVVARTQAGDVRQLPAVPA